MAETTEQVKPLAPAAGAGNKEEALKRTRRRTKIKCCGCIGASLLLLIIVIVILIFTVFKVKDPKVTMNGISVTDLDLKVDAIPQLQARLNMSLNVDMSVKNPNSVSFKFGNTTTILYYRGITVAEVRGPPGQAKARRTFRMNMTADIMADRLVSSPDFVTDMGAREMKMNSYSIIGGRANVLNIVKKHVDIKMNCSFTVNISTPSIQDMSCKRQVQM